eukprot:TRINITY_DN3782_c0_g3_i2.p1 TRINITY_DN3782_c0_g3~~TRINITY_DN3782_c0_g3_i2.p1  ORF type:complete len:421 (+),score=91.31 TRINITY_DN3782_c0_g3_i2:85-1263(+)
MAAAFAALFGARALGTVFAATAAPPPKSLFSPRQLRAASAAFRPAKPSGEAGESSTSTSVLCGAVAAAIAIGAASSSRDSARRSARASSAAQCNAFGSSSSGFMGASCASTYITRIAATEAAPTAPTEDAFMATAYQGVAGMAMKAQVWWHKNTGADGLKQGGTPAGLFDRKRRESRRRGEELFRHDVDNFELTTRNLIPAPGSIKKKIKYGRSKYGQYGRTCGRGTTTNGAKKRGRRTLNPWYEGAATPLHLRSPKLTLEDRLSMRKDLYQNVSLSILNLLSDGDVVDYNELLVKGLPVARLSRKGFTKVKIIGRDEDELTVKDLVVYAHAFEPAAREKIEENGGKCIRLSELGGIPLDPNAIKINLPNQSEEEEEAPVAVDSDGGEAASE